MCPIISDDISRNFLSLLDYNEISDQFISVWKKILVWNQLFFTFCLSLVCWVFSLFVSCSILVGFQIGFALNLDEYIFQLKIISIDVNNF